MTDNATRLAIARLTNLERVEAAKAGTNNNCPCAGCTEVRQLVAEAHQEETADTGRAASLETGGTVLSRRALEPDPTEAFFNKVFGLFSDDELDEDGDDDARLRQARKDTPIASGVIAYFPKALCAVAQVSKVGNDQHNPGEPLHWAREKSTDETDALTRHLLDYLNGADKDVDGMLHLSKVAWRALALLERFLDGEEPGRS